MEFDMNGRMKLNPEFHHAHGQPYTTSEFKYLIENFELVGAETMALELGRTENSITSKVCKLRKAGLMPKPVNKKYRKRVMRGLNE